MNTEQKSNFPNPWLEIGQKQEDFSSFGRGQKFVDGLVKELATQKPKKVRKSRKSK